MTGRALASLTKDGATALKTTLSKFSIDESRCMSIISIFGIDMKSVSIKLLIAISCVVSSSSVLALKGFDSKDTSIGSSEKSIEIRRSNDDGTRSKIRGEVDSQGDFRGRDVNGNKYRGSIDDDGYGKIKDADGNSYKVKPRY